MRTRIIRIGRSRRIQIPQQLLEQAGLHDAVELSVEDGALVLRPVRRPRAGWAAAFENMSQCGDDVLLDVVPPSTWDAGEWEW